MTNKELIDSLLPARFHGDKRLTLINEGVAFLGVASRMTGKNLNTFLGFPNSKVCITAYLREDGSKSVYVRDMLRPCPAA